MLLTCGAFTPQGEFLELPELDLERLQTAWQEAVFALSLAEFTQHIPPKGAHLIRYYGWYSNKARGMRRKAAETAAAGSPGTSASQAAESAPARSRASQTWAMLIKRVYEIDPLICPRCSGQMKIVAFIEPPQGGVIEKILRHCGLWCPAAPRAPPAGDLRVHDPDGDSAASDEPRELTYVDEATFWSTFWFFPTHVGTRPVRAGNGSDATFAT